MSSFPPRAGHCRPVSGPRGAVAAAHPLAVSAGTSILAAGGSAVDAAIAAQAVICVAMPHAAGLGGDMLALVRDAGGTVVAINGTGRSGSAAQKFSTTGGASVTVPGLVGGWVESHRRWGRLDLSQVLADALRLAEGGVAVEAGLARARDRQQDRLSAGGAAGWSLLDRPPGAWWRQPELARLLGELSATAGACFYQAGAAAAMADAVQRHGGSLTLGDFGRHRTEVGAPVTVPFDGGDLSVQPPSSQGVLLALAVTAAESLPGSASDELIDHLLVEITEAAFAFRSDCADVAGMLARKLPIDTERAARRGGPRSYLHTAGVATADASGLVVSSLLSVFDDFGSGVFVPELGLCLNNRAAGFTDGANSAAPDKRPIHTLAPALLERADRSVLALATPGADGQVQTLLQMLAGLRSGRSLAEALAFPRWRSENHQLMIEADHPHRTALAGRGHHLTVRPAGDDLFGAVVAAGIDDGRPFAAADWRRWVNSAAT